MMFSKKKDDIKNNMDNIMEWHIFANTYFSFIVPQITQKVKACLEQGRAVPEDTALCLAEQ